MRENTDQKKTPYLDTFHAVSLQFAIFFTIRCLDVRSQDLLYFHLFEVLSIVLVSSSLQGRECVGLAVFFNKEGEETFAVSLQNCKSFACLKYLTLVRPLKLIALNFTFL